MSYFSGFEDVSVFQVDGLQRFSDEDAYKYIDPFFQNPVYYQNSQLQSDDTDHLRDRVQAFSFDTSTAISPLNLFSRLPKDESFIPCMHEYFRQTPAIGSHSFSQDSCLTQPYPLTPAPTNSHRRSSPFETISSISSQFEGCDRYPTNSTDSDPESSASPDVTWVDQELAYPAHYGSQMFLFNKDPGCHLSQIQSFSDYDFTSSDLSFRTDFSFQTPAARSSYDDFTSAEEKPELVVDVPITSDFLSDDERDSDYSPNPSKTRRTSRSTAKQQVQGPARSKITKRAPSKPQPNQSIKAKQQIQVTASPTEDSVDNPSEYSQFPCPLTPYGCKSTFKSKNEWKRHITSRHIYLGFWRCDCCPDSETRPNEFNRKDLFTQHLRRMHHPQKDGASNAVSKRPPKSKKTNKSMKNGMKDAKNLVDSTTENFENSLEEIRDRCWIQIRSYPTKALCAFCDKLFEGEGSFEDWLEHAGKHLTNSAKQSQSSLPGSENIRDTHVWLKDTAFRDWLLDQGFLKAGDDGQLRLVDEETAHDINLNELQSRHNL